jgi:hypothetical protein
LLEIANDLIKGKSRLAHNLRHVSLNYKQNTCRLPFVLRLSREFFAREAVGSCWW